MKFLYSTRKVKIFSSPVLKMIIVVLLSVNMFTTVTAQTNIPELIFENPVLSSGRNGKDNAVYRFGGVAPGIDALVKIVRRSSTLVKLVNIDINNTGHNNAFQPELTYNNGNVPDSTDWWIEFQISFIDAHANLVNVQNFDVTSLDIDGDNGLLNEYVSFYGQNSYLVEANSALHISNVEDTIGGGVMPGKRFDGAYNTYPGIDTTATDVMVTNTYSNTNTFTLRIGGKTYEASSLSDRMYSLWFKGFNFNVPTQVILPASLTNWNATYANNNVALKWTTTFERNVNYFTIERSYDGIDFSDAAMVFANGNSEAASNYFYNDKVNAGFSGVIYYRLLVTDLDGSKKVSDVRIVRISKNAQDVKIVAYPNPVVTDVRITVPQHWQDKAVTYQVIATNGQIVKAFTVQHASQTEIVSMTQVPAGMYVVKATSGIETSAQTIVKTNN